MKYEKGSCEIVGMKIEMRTHISLDPIVQTSRQFVRAILWVHYDIHYFP